MKRIHVNLTALLFVAILAFAALPLLGAEETPVKAWEEKIVIPTYLVGAPEPNPMFYFGSESQGAQDRIYPYPLYDSLTHKKADKTYKIVYLENQYIRVGILPEIGGRLFEGIDKTNNYNFIYRQHVIKPALIGLIGTWISGGIEWNIPHHHRATSALPVQYRIEQSEDGSKTVWVGELEIRHRMRWAVGYTLRPGKSYLEAQVRIVNRTPVVETMLCFANVAVNVNDQYQTIFPPSTQYGTYHFKNQFIKWPIADSIYNGADFTKGVDVSWHKNHIEANSIFAWNYMDDFFAGYDHGKQAGIMSIADTHIAPGKKIWTWGNGPEGRMWDRILTDTDGSYNELMRGAYSDNQPDYSWLQPFDTKSFSMYWYPFRDIDGAKEANLDAVVNLEVEKNGTAKLGFYTTSAHRSATVLLQAGSKVLLRENIAIDPGKPWVKQVAIPAGIDEHDLRASLSAEGRELVAYSPVRLTPEAMPKPVTRPPAPQEIRTNEELYLTGLRLQQFHASYADPEDYWKEALRRDPGDARVNTALGITRLREARFSEAEEFFRKALERLTDKYTTPKDAEPIYYLGLTLKAEGRFDEAYKYFYLATWNLPWRAAGYYGLAEIATGRGDLMAALDFVNRSLDDNGQNIRALTLKGAVLRHMGRKQEAIQVLAVVHRSDPLDVRSMAELWLASGRPETRNELTASMNEYPATAAETAAEYYNAGLWSDGAAILSQSIAAAPDQSRIQPMVYYYLGYFAEKMNQPQKALEDYALAGKMPPDYVFPFQYEAIEVLRSAMKANPRDARAPYYLGNLLFDWQPADAISLWETSAALDPSFAIVHRNLGVAWSNQKSGNSLDKAIAQMEQAISLEHKYPLHFAELDKLYEAVGGAPEKRLALLENNQSMVAQRDDSLSREIALLVALGKFDEAIGLLSGKEFSVWEGGNDLDIAESLSVADDWADAHMLRGQQRLQAGQSQEAIADFKLAVEIPANLPSENRIDREPEADYRIGKAYQALGDVEQAKQYWQKSVAVVIEPPAPGQEDSGIGARTIQTCYQALSLRDLGQKDQASARFQELIESANRVIQQGPTQFDLSASLTDLLLQRSRLATAHYLAGLSYLGLADKEKATQELSLALQARPGLSAARFTLAQLR
jgi:tetratricopeptide (TPR) repeat protein